VLILNNGRIAAQGTPEEITQSLNMDREKTSLEDIFVKLTREGEGR